MVTRLHGTDGIRGRIEEFDGDDEAALNALVERRVLSNRSMRIIGEATGLFLVEDVGESPLVILGWDRRDGNAALVDALESGLGAAGCRTLRVGEVPTPGLHLAVLEIAADAGMMVTASHNPATDSGVKFFDSEGYKSMPDVEDQISNLAWRLADGSLATPQEKSEPLEEIDGQILYRQGLDRRMDELGRWLGYIHDWPQQTSWKNVIPPQGLLLDSSGGTATEWLAEGMSRVHPFTTIEVSSRLNPINQDCGAGGLSPTDKWSIEELLMKESSHRLLWAITQRLEENEGIPPWESGQIVGAALDGDGDRCLLIEATSEGLQVVDGDRMCDDIMRAAISAQPSSWKMAASIESDLGLTADLSRLGEHESVTTAVGDRWLSAALWPQTVPRWFRSKQAPKVIGTEDSGHLVMPTPLLSSYVHPMDEFDRIEHPGLTWALVGDGIATLHASLIARVALCKGDAAPAFKGGWKKRISIQPSVRERWTGDNELSSLVQTTAEQWCGTTLVQTGVEGESALQLLEGTLNGLPISIAVRNSGTEAKTSISIRFARGIEVDGDELMSILEEELRPHLSP